MQVWDGHHEEVYALAFSPDGPEFASGGKDGRVIVHDAFGGQRQVAGTGPEAWPVHAVGYRRGGELLYTADRAVRSYRPDPDPACPDVVQADRFTPLAFSVLDETTLAVGCGNRIKPEPGLFFLWDFPTGKRRTPAFHEPAGVRAVVAHPPSRLVAWANGSRRVTVWDATKPDLIHYNQSHNSPSLSFHPDGRLLAAAAEWGFRVYDVEARQERLAVRGHKGQVTGVAFSPDGRTLATGSWDETVRLWDVATGAETACFRWPVGKVFSLAYAPDGLRLAAGGNKGAIVVWDVG